MKSFFQPGNSSSVLFTNPFASASSSSPSRSSAAPKTTIEIVLMLDISYSMHRELNVAKNKLAELSQSIAKSNPAATVRIAVVAYSDYQDDRVAFAENKPDHWLKNNTAACTVCDFTDTKTATQFLNKLSILNGADEPEAMELALYKVRHLQWTLARPGDRIVRQVFSVSDSLPHACGDKTTTTCDAFPTVSSIPSRLDWREQVVALKKSGIEVHILYSGKKSGSLLLSGYAERLHAQIHAVNMEIAGDTGTVNTLDKADDLIAKVTQVVQAEDELDALIGMLKISEGETETEVDMLTGMLSKTKIDIDPVAAITDRFGIPAENAVAKLLSHQNRYASAATAAASDSKEEKVDAAPPKSVPAFGTGMGWPKF